MDRNRFRVSFLTAVMVLSALSGCGDRSAEWEKEDIPGSAEQSNVQGTINGDVREDQEPDMDIREETNVPNETKESEEPDKIRSAYEVREGVSGFTLQYDDLPEVYQVTSSFSYEAMNRRPPLPEGDSTVLRAVPDPAQTQVFYLWEEGDAPARTSFTSDMTGYYDSYDFRPYVTALTIPEGVEAKGAVVLLAGGAFQFRGDYTDTLPTAVQLREYGYRCFIVDYRLRPCPTEVRQPCL